MSDRVARGPVIVRHPEVVAGYITYVYICGAKGEQPRPVRPLVSEVA